MELAPLGSRKRRLRRALVLLLAGVLVPLMLLVVLPALLGLHTRVVDPLDSGGRALLVSRAVPSSDLAAGQVILRRDAGGTWIEQRVVEAEPGFLVVSTEPDESSVRLPTSQHPTLHLAVASVPYVGALFSPVGLLVGVAALAVAGLVLPVVASAWRRRRQTTGSPSV